MSIQNYKNSRLSLGFLLLAFFGIGVFISSSINRNSFSHTATVLSPSSVWGTHQVQGLQSTLALAGFYNGPVNGVFTPTTRRALRSFQRQHNIRPTGVISEQTISEVNEYLINENFLRNSGSDDIGDSLSDGGNPPIMQMMGGGVNCGINFFDPGQSGIIDVPYQVHAFYDLDSSCLWDIDPVTGKVIDFYLYNWDWQVGGVGALYTTEDPVPEGFSIPPGAIHLTGTILPTGNDLFPGSYMTPSNWIGTIDGGEPSSYMGFWLSYEPGFSNIDNDEIACLSNSSALLIYLSQNPGVVPPPFCSDVESYNASNYICEPPIITTLGNSPSSIQNGFNGNQLVYEGAISSNSPGEDTPCDVLVKSVTVGLFADGATLTSFDVTGSEGVFTDTGMYPTSLIDTFNLGTTTATKLEITSTPPDNSETISISAKDIVVPPGVSNVTAGVLEMTYKFSWEPGGATRKVIFSNAMQSLSVLE